MFAKDQVKVGPVIRTELLAELALALAVRLECNQRSCRYTDRPWPLRFCSFELHDVLGLCERPCDYGATILDIRPTERQHLATARAGRGRYLQEHRQAPRVGRRLDQEILLRWR